MHLDVIRERLKHRFDVEIVTKDPKIPYRETIQANGEGDYKHKKQTGGRGQFAEVHLRIFPLSRDIKSPGAVREGVREPLELREAALASTTIRQMNFAFLDHIVGGTIPNNFVPAIEKGVREMMDRGALAGYRMQDIAVEVHFGKYHDVDSSEAAFKTAARYAFKKAFLAARPTLLEPIVKLEITDAVAKFTGARPRRPADEAGARREPGHAGRRSELDPGAGAARRGEPGTRPNSAA